MTHSKLQGCAVTLNQVNPWWKAELKQLSSIHNVNIMPRQDCCKDRYTKVTVSTSLDGKVWTLCKDLGDALSKSNTWVKAICPAGTLGKYIKFVQYNSKEEFAVCEVEAFGYPAGTCFLRSFNNLTSIVTVNVGNLDIVHNNLDIVHNDRSMWVIETY